jgi:NADPH:quinone reductase-like Zn-dependent oxidoreductase
VIALDSSSARRHQPARTVLVTGAASGLGASVVARARASGWTAVGVDAEPCRGIDHLVADLADETQLAPAVARLAARSHGLRAVVAVSGIEATVRAALPFLSAPDGTVVAIASARKWDRADPSSAGTMGEDVVGVTHSLAEELRGRAGVTLLARGGPGDEPASTGDLAAAVMHVLSRPAGCVIPELVVARSAPRPSP